MIDCKNISVSINGETILRDVCCEMPRNRFTAIIGRNGSGKTTLVNCICKQMKFTGRIKIGAADISDLPSREMAKQIAYLPQKLVTPSVTVAELVGFGRMPYIGLQKKLSQEDLEAVTAALTQTQMQPFSGRMISSLSGGERQKAFLAMILAQKTDILVLDEPNTFMDAAAQIQFLSLLKNLTATGKTVITVVHDLSLAAAFADHIIIMDNGRCIFSDSKEACIRQEQIESTFSVSRYECQCGNTKQIFFK